MIQQIIFHAGKYDRPIGSCGDVGEFVVIDDDVLIVAAGAALT